MMHVKDEQEMREEIRKLLQKCGWQYTYNPNAGTGKGDWSLPDVIAVHRDTGRLVFIDMSPELEGKQGWRASCLRRWRKALLKDNHEYIPATVANFDVVHKLLADEAPPHARTRITRWEELLQQRGLT